MLYDGHAYPLNIDSFKSLAEKGIVIIVIEKEGIAEALEPFARKYKVALVHTGGRFTEAAIDLIEAAKNTTSVVAILVDYDAVGNAIVDSTLTNTLKLGIDKDTIKWLQQNGYPDLTVEDVKEEYTPSVYTADEYLKYHRIELDSIQEKVGAKGLWDYIMYQLEKPEFSPNGFDINRVLNIQDDIISKNRKLYSKPVRKLLEYLDAYNQRRLEAIADKIADDELTSADTLPVFDDLKQDIENTLSKAVEKDDSGSMKKVVDVIGNLMGDGSLSAVEDLKPIEAEAVETKSKSKSKSKKR